MADINLSSIKLLKIFLFSSLELFLNVINGLILPRSSVNITRSSSTASSTIFLIYLAIAGLLPPVEMAIFILFFFNNRWNNKRTQIRHIHHIT